MGELEYHSVIVTLAEYQSWIAALPHGKRLPAALYVHRDGLAGSASELHRWIGHLTERYAIGAEFNVLKFRTDELKVSFLAYPRFCDDPHPALHHAITIDLVRGKARHTDYATNPNPPILHRKEAFLPADHPKRRRFGALTAAEEAVGLYANPATIGFKLNWERLVASKGLRYRGHRLLLECEHSRAKARRPGPTASAAGLDHGPADPRPSESNKQPDPNEPRGSTCLADADEPSHVVKAMKPDIGDSRRMIRFPPGLENVDAVVRASLSTVARAGKVLRR